MLSQITNQLGIEDVIALWSF